MLYNDSENRLAVMYGINTFGGHNSLTGGDPFVVILFRVLTRLKGKDIIILD